MGVADDAIKTHLTSLFEHQLAGRIGVLVHDNSDQPLAVIIREMASFFIFGEQARADDPPWIGVRQLAVQRVWS